MNEPDRPEGWREEDSEAFVAYGCLFVPERAQLHAMIADLVPPCDGPFTVAELCCGEGLLAEVLLERFPACTVLGFDGAPEMLRAARRRLASHGARFVARAFDLAATDWRRLERPVQAVVTSLAVHHLDASQKQALFRDVHAMLAPGGALLVADLVAPALPAGWDLAARAWDEAVRAQARRHGEDEEAALAAFERERWNLYRYFDPDDIDRPSPLFDQLRWLDAAGFSAIDVYWMRAGHALFGGVR